MVATEENIEGLESKLHIRKLKTKDLFTFVGVLKPYIDMNRIIEIVSKMPKDAKERESYNSVIGAEVFAMLADALTDNKLQSWLADLANMTVEEFEETDPEATFLIIQKVAQENDLLSFFSRVLDILTKSFGSNSTKSKKGTRGQMSMF